MTQHAAFEPLALGRLRMRNRVIKTATYEGMVVDGLPSAALLRHHRELAAGGVGMTTVAYCSVSPEGRTFKNQMVMDARTVAPLRAITDAVHAEGGAAMLQVGHCGGFSKNEDLGTAGPKGPSFGFNAYGALKGMPFTREMKRADLDETKRAFGTATSRAFEAGFDAVELHLGHGYLLSQFLSPHRNARRDEYGGSLENRMRYPLEVFAHVRETVGPDAPLFVKMNLDDGVRGGLGLEDAVAIARALEQAGATALVLSGGLVSHSALYLLRGERPLAAMIDVETNPLQKVAIGLFGPMLIPKIAFEPMFFLEQARAVRRAVRMPLVYLGGATGVEHLDRARAEGFEMVAMGRALLREPDLIARFARGEASESRCTPCNLCITEMDRPGGVVCAKEPWQLARRDDEVARRLHLTVAGT